MCDEVKVKSYVMSCCPEGTFVRQSGQLLSFKTERHPACPQLAMKAENIQDPYQWVVGVGVVLTIIIVVIYLSMWILHHYQKKGQDQYGRSRQMQRDQGVEMRRSKKSKEAAQKR